MFYACLVILLLFLIMCSCVTMAIIDLEMYNFGLYIVLLCIVDSPNLIKLFQTHTVAYETEYTAVLNNYGNVSCTMLACALCIANPQACPNPGWYTKFCILLHAHIQEMYPIPADGSSSPKMNGLRARMQAHAQSIATSDEGQRLPLRQESRATVAMLAPAVHIMHQVWKGMAWVTDGIEEDDEDTRTYDKLEQGPSDETSESLQAKRLSTIAETSSCFRELDEISSEINSRNDVTL